MGFWTARWSEKRKRLFVLSFPETRWTNYVAIWWWPGWRFELVRSNSLEHDRWIFMKGERMLHKGRFT